MWLILEEDPDSRLQPLMHLIAVDQRNTCLESHAARNPFGTLVEALAFSHTLSSCVMYQRRLAPRSSQASLSAPWYLQLCLGGARLANLELAVCTLVNVPVRPAVAHGACPGDEIGIRLDDGERVSATGHGGVLRGRGLCEMSTETVLSDGSGNAVGGCDVPEVKLPEG